VWSAGEIAELKALIASGYTYEEAGKKFGISRSAASGIIFRNSPEKVVARRAPQSRGKNQTSHWDEVLFEPWEQRKARLARERRRVNV
jgi:transposase